MTNAPSVSTIGEEAVIATKPPSIPLVAMNGSKLHMHVTLENSTIESDDGAVVLVASAGGTNVLLCIIADRGVPSIRSAGMTSWYGLHAAMPRGEGRREAQPDLPGYHPHDHQQEALRKTISHASQEDGSAGLRERSLLCDHGSDVLERCPPVWQGAPANSLKTNVKMKTQKKKSAMQALQQHDRMLSREVISYL